MASQNGRTDSNSRATKLAAVDDGTLNPQLLKVDHSTGRLLIEVHIVTDTTPNQLPMPRRTDGNSVATSSAEYDDGSGTISALLIDSRNGCLWVDLIEE